MMPTSSVMYRPMPGRTGSPIWAAALSASAKLTIPAAIDTALSGDAVQVAPGQYAGGATTWNVRNKTVRLVPKGTVTVK